MAYFKENPSRDKIDMNLKPVTFSYAIDLESAWLSDGLCKPSFLGKHFTNV